MAEDSVAHAIDLIKSGKKEEGKNLLIEQIIKAPYNEEAWLWMSSASSGAERINCLEKALEINPQNQHARKMLDKLTAPASENEKSGKGDSVQQAHTNNSAAAKPINDGDEEVVFSPNPGIVFLVHILPWVIVFAYLTLLAATVEGWLEAQQLIIMGCIFVLICVLMMIRKLRVYKVRISQNGISGPVYFVQAWFKHEIPIAKIDLKETGTTLGFLGFYRLRSVEGASVYLIGYSEEALLKIASLIKYYQSQG